MQTRPLHCSGSPFPLALFVPAGGPSMFVPVNGSPGSSGFSPISMPKPALLWAVLFLTLWPPSATAMPFSGFSLAVLPSIRAPPTGRPLVSKIPLSIEMPAPPVRLATLFLTIMFAPFPSSKPVCSELEALLSSTRTLFDSPASTPFGL